MKGDTVYKRTFNRALDLIEKDPQGAESLSENALRDRLEASRTTIRKVLRELATRGVLEASGETRRLSRAPNQTDYFARAETVPTSAQVEKKFMEWMLRADRKPGDGINESELARKAGVSTSGIREFLNRFSRFGLIEKRESSGWVFRGFTEDFALELFEVRELFETRSAFAFAAQADDAVGWVHLAELETEHRRLQDQIATRYHDFSDLDERFHRLINDASRNRFIGDFHDLISLIFHYHYQWNKVDERQRNEVAIAEHLTYIAALFSRDPRRIEFACKNHLNSARKTLVASIAQEGLAP